MAPGSKLPILLTRNEHNRSYSRSRGKPMRRVLLILLLAIMAGTPAYSQDPVTRANQNYRREVTGAVEEFLFQNTGKTTQIIYLKIYVEERPNLYCGQALFGSSRQSFILDARAKTLSRPASTAMWASAGCNVAGGEVLIDLR